MLRLHKLNVIEMNTTGVIQHDAIVFDMSDYITIPLEPDNIKYNRHKAIRERKKTEQLSRAKIKEETRKALKDYYERED